MPLKTTKNAAYDNAVSLAREYLALPISAAGSTGTFGQYFALGNEYLWAAHAIQRVAGTSTYTTTDTFISTGVSTTAVNTNTAATTVQAFRVAFTTSGTTTSTATTTYQLFSVAAQNSTNGTNMQHNFTACGTAASGTGGVALNIGDQIYMVNGTDATATSIPVWEMSFTPLANVTA